MIDPRSSAPGHLDLDALADSLADGGPDADPQAMDRTLGEQEAAHLRTCASCQDRLAELAAAEVGVVAGLASLPEPPLPDGLAERLARALPPRVAPATGDPGAGSRRVAHLPRRRAWLPSVAAGVALVLAGGLGWTALSNGVGDTDDADTAASSAGGEAGPSDTGSSDATGPAAQSESAPEDPAAMAQPPVTTPRSGDSRVDYADETALRGRLPQLLALPRAAGRGTPPSATSPDTSEADLLARLRSPEALEQCLAALQASDEVAPERTGPPAGDGRPLAVDHARFRSAPALAVVLPDADPGQVVVAVVGPACGPGDPAVLRVTRVPSP